MGRWRRLGRGLAWTLVLVVVAVLALLGVVLLGAQTGWGRDQLRSLIVAQAKGSLPLLLLGTTLSGISGALGYRGSLQVVNQIAPAEQRAGVASAYFLVCFIGNSLPVIAVAILARAFNSLVADGVFAITLALLALTALAVSQLQSR